MDNRVFFTGALDPSAQEFTPPTLFPVAPAQIYYPYPYLPHCEIPPLQNISYPAPPAYIRLDPPPLPVALPPPSPTPTRSLLLSSVPTEVSESTIRRDLEVFGDVRAVEMERVKQGIVAVHFYDLRHAQTALGEIQEQHMQHQCRVRQHFETGMTVCNSPYEVVAVSFPVPLPPPACGLVSGHAVWAQFMVPEIGGYPESFNQGTLAIFNVAHQVPAHCLREIFEEFGYVKELREPPNPNQRFIEFYDTRDAARAVARMNGKEINGRRLAVEFSRPACYNKRFPNSTNHPARSPRLVTPVNDRSPAFIRSRSVPSQSHFSGRNSKSPSGSRNTSVGQGVRVASTGSNGGERVQCKKTSETSSSIRGGTSTKQVNNNKVGCSKDRKGSIKNEKEHDPRFLINEDSIVLPNCTDPRTTVMIKNIPNKYSQKLLLNMLDNHCIHCNEQIDDNDEQPLSSYDFVYLPIDFVNKCNVGYGFVNMTSPEATLRLYNSFHHQNWEVFNSRKICQVTYARLQGLEALKEHFKTSKFPWDAEEYMPVVFSPPRDGRTLSKPVPVINQVVRNNEDHGDVGQVIRNNDEDHGDDDEAAELRQDHGNKSNDGYNNNVIFGGKKSVWQRRQ